MDQTAAQVLDSSTRGLLVTRGVPRAGGDAPAPIVAPVTCWFDGRAAWTTIPADSDRVAALTHDPTCALSVPPGDGEADDAGRPGVLAEGRARIFSLGDPLGLVLHAPVIALALAALAAHAAGGIGRQVQGAVTNPAVLIPENRVVLRVVVDRARPVGLLPPPPGIAPPLPPVVPSDVRRVIAGRRQVLLAADHGHRLLLAPATWGTGFTLHPAAGSDLPEGVQVTAAVDVSGGHGDGVGLAIHGALAAGPVLEPRRVTWWKGPRLQSAEVPATGPRPGAITLPD